MGHTDACVDEATVITSRGSAQVTMKAVRCVRMPAIDASSRPQWAAQPAALWVSASSHRGHQS
ncbi:hypothetical protein CBOM_07732 [Ceraceosorus bombacis]|uniref:Uncharacterized protein n=1 Tax=Ceraceosorus bombacis TaxID=401625 RepID=A0A0P1BI39_9BASI|nr:hypothetical protein CBOM_07732 [Ceraceosorus bombacis]